jgi:regulator of protease activity HflC (stomatin/prohibitin superfamily)
MAIGIFVGILIIVLFAVCVVSCLMLADNSKTGASAIAGVLAFAMVIAFLLVPFSFHTVSSGEVAVVKHLGKIEDVKSAGTHYDLWVTNKYVTYDTKIQDFEVFTAAYSSDAQPMEIAMTIQYQILSDKVVDIATQYGKLDILQNRIESVAIERVKSVLSAHKAMDIIAKRATISPEVETAIKELIGDEYYVNVTTVVLDNIDFSDAFEQAVEDKMIAEQAKLKADYDNETKVAKARADAEAKLKAAQAQIDIAKAEAEARMIAAEGEAKANEIVSASITDKILEKNTIEKWDGKLPVVSGNGEYMLPSEIIG